MEKEKCQYCGKEVPKLDLKDHEEECPKNFKGFDFWLELFGIFFVIGIIVNFFSIFSYENNLAFTFSILIFVYSLLIFYFYIKKKKEFVPNVKIYLWILIVIWFFSLINNPLSYGILIVSVLWLIYFYRSKRVKNTFVNETKWIKKSSKIMKKSSQQKSHKDCFLNMKNNRKINIGFFVFFILIIILLFFNSSSYGTDPEAVKNYTEGKFEFKEREKMNFTEFYSLVISNETSEPGERLESPNLSTDTPELQAGYDYYAEETEYYEECDKKRIKINFTESREKYSDFSFNYLGKTFDYKIKLNNQLWIFSEELKNQDCYFDEDTYEKGYLEDPYNNKFLESISEDFGKLEKKGYSEDEIVEMATIFVQSIPYGNNGTGFVNQYPYETICEKIGNCLDKSVILTGILKNLNYTSYIISGYAGEPHSLVGIGCEEGNINYNGTEICFIETTMFSPIGEESNITIEKYVPVSQGDKIYSGENYGHGLAEKIKKKEEEIIKIDSKLDSMKENMSKLDEKMYETDCISRSEEVNEEGEIMVTESISTYCNDAYEYNKYVDEYNELSEKHNSLLEDWYKKYYELENMMFNNPEYIERLE